MSYTGEKAKEYQREWYEKNREEVLARSKAHYWANRERARAKHRQWYQKNRDKVRAKSKENYRRNRESARDRKNQKLYGLAPEAYRSMVESQDSACAICREKPRALCVDHCHETGRVRGLLCQACNWAIGTMLDNPQRLRAAADYLEAT